MKTIILTVSTAILSISFIPNEVRAEVTHPTELTSDTAQMELTILTRLNEIKAMDMSTLNRSEKRDLKKEVRSSENQLREMHGGVYISVGALIIIILLLIIIF